MLSEYLKDIDKMFFDSMFGWIILTIIVVIIAMVIKIIWKKIFKK